MQILMGSSPPLFLIRSFLSYDEREGRRKGEEAGGLIYTTRLYQFLGHSTLCEFRRKWRIPWDQYVNTISGIDHVAFAFLGQMLPKQFGARPDQTRERENEKPQKLTPFTHSYYYGRRGEGPLCIVLRNGSIGPNYNQGGIQSRGKIPGLL